MPTAYFPAACIAKRACSIYWTLIWLSYYSRCLSGIDSLNRHETTDLGFYRGIVDGFTANGIDAKRVDNAVKFLTITAVGEKLDVERSGGELVDEGFDLRSNDRGEKGSQAGGADARGCGIMTVTLDVGVQMKLIAVVTGTFLVMIWNGSCNSGSVNKNKHLLFSVVKQFTLEPPITAQKMLTSEQ